MLRLSLTSPLVVLAFAAAAGCGSPPGPPTDGGLVVCNANLADAIANAADGVTLYICAGTYDEQLVINGKRIGLEGPGDPNAVVIDAGGAGSALTIEGGADVVIRGITFTHGAARDGGALACRDSHVLIDNSRFTDSTAIDRGGGVSFACDGQIARSQITGNQARVGGGVVLASGQPLFSENEVAGNSAKDDGGGVYVDQTTATLRANHIHHNHCDDDGGGLRIFESEALVEANLIEDNTTADGGGGIRVSHVPSTFIGNTVRNNEAGNTGGGMDMDNDASTVIGGEISGNHAAASGGGIFHWLGPWNGAVLTGIRITGNEAYRGGGIFLDDNLKPVTMTALFVAENKASKGAGLMVRGTDYTIRSSVFLANDGSKGGAIYAGVNSEHSAWTEPCPPCPPTEPVGRIDFTTFQANSADEGAAIWTDTARVTVANSIVSASDGPAITVKPPGSPPRWTYNDTVPPSFAGMFDPTGRDGNLSAPPLYIDPATDFHLKAGSACIDAADPTMKDPDGSRADMGSFGGPP